MGCGTGRRMGAPGCEPGMWIITCGGNAGGKGGNPGRRPQINPSQRKHSFSSKIICTHEQLSPDSGHDSNPAAWCTAGRTLKCRGTARLYIRRRKGLRVWLDWLKCFIHSVTQRDLVSLCSRGPSAILGIGDLARSQSPCPHTGAFPDLRTNPFYYPSMSTDVCLINTSRRRSQT